MSLIQVILVLSALFSLLIYLVYFRSLLRDRLLVLVIVMVAIVAIMFPNLTTVVANTLGVGRGADLLIYIIAMGGVFALLLISNRLVTIEKTITELVRQTAISNAQEPKESRK